MADTSMAPFVMHGARAAITDGMLHIEQQVNTIELAVAENPGLAFDLAKTLIESVCRTILSQRAISHEPGDNLPKLFKTVTNTLPFLPASANREAEVRKSLAQTLNGLHTAIQGVCGLRNQCGFASHGTDGPRPVMETVQALLAAETADAIVGFLHRIHIQDGSPPDKPQLNYDDNPDFNEYVDDVHERIYIFDEDFDPSRILYELAPEPYRINLTVFKAGPDAGDSINPEAPEL